MPKLLSHAHQRIRLRADAPKRAPHRGFTVIELLIVLALLAIAVAIGYPRYHAYNVRTEVAQVLKQSDKDSKALSDYYGKTGSMPENRAAAAKAEIALSRATGSKHLARVQYRYSPGDKGTKDTVSLTYTLAHIDSSVNGKTIVLTSDIQPSKVQWHCTSADIKAEYLPSRCKSTAE